MRRIYKQRFPAPPVQRILLIAEPLDAPRMFPLVQMLLRISQERVPRIFNLHLRNGILWLLEDLFLARMVSITISFAFPISSGLPNESLVGNEIVVEDIGRYPDLLNRLVACDRASFNRNRKQQYLRRLSEVGLQLFYTLIYNANLEF